MEKTILTLTTILFATALSLGGGCATTVNAADPYSWMRGNQIAQAPAYAAPHDCPCGPDCQCGADRAELLRLRVYKERMEAWIAKHDYRNPALYVSQTVQSEPLYVEAPIVRYSTGNRTATPYTGGRYTNWIPGFKAIRGQGACVGGNCPR